MKLGRAMILSLAALGPLPDRCRRPLLRMVGFRVARDCGIRAGLRVSGYARVEIESGAFINFDVSIQADAPVSIGRNVQLAPGVQLVTADHELGGPHGRAGADTATAIVIGEGTWIAVGAIVLPGVTIGPGCVIAAGAVVREDCVANTLYAGVPARAVRELPT
jgi:maltose O-acetyltransferase